MALWKNSRYLSVEDTITYLDPTNNDEKTTLGIRMMPKIRDYNTIYNVGVNEDLFDIAIKFFGDARLWWMIADANRNVITDPYNLETGMQILIPD